MKMKQLVCRADGRVTSKHSKHHSSCLSSLLVRTKSQLLQAVEYVMLRLSPVICLFNLLLIQNLGAAVTPPAQERKKERKGTAKWRHSSGVLSGGLVHCPLAHRLHYP